MKKLLACFVFFMAGLACCQEMKSFNINMTNENRQAVKTGFVLSCKIEAISKPDEINDPLTKKAVKTTCDIIDAMHKGDKKRLAELSYSQKEIDFYDKLLQFQKITYTSDTVEFTSQIKLADKRLVFYKTFLEMNNMKIPVNQFTMLCEKDNDFVFVMPDERESMIVMLVSGSLDNPLFEDKSAPKKGEVLHKMGLCKDEASGNDCFLQFTGIPVTGIDVNTYDDQHKHANATAHEIISLFKSSLNDIKTKSTEEYANLYYTKQSQKTFTTSLARMQKEGLETYLARITNGGYIIHYIIDAAPYYIVFYTQKENQLEFSEKKTKKYNYIFCIRENQKLKFTNYLKSNTFFDTLIKKNIIDIDKAIDPAKTAK